VRDPFLVSEFEPAELTVPQEDELREIRNDRRLKLKPSSTDMTSFWLSLRQEYSIITKVAEALLFLKSYLCESFSLMNTMESKHRSLLQALKDMRLCLLIISSRTRDIMRHHQDQISQ
jgi:hypothetical protein